MNYYLSIDCGLTKIKASIFTEDGQKIYEEQADTPVSQLKVDTFSLRRILVCLIRKLLETSQIDAKDIKAIATSGHGNGIYLVGEDGVLPQGYSSMFDLNSKYTPDTEDVFPYTNQTSWNGQPLPILAYIKHEEPDIWRQIKKVLFCKDVIKYFLTGKIATEYTDASAAGLLNYRTSDYDKELMDIYGLGDSMDIFPELTYSTDIIGTVRIEFAKETGLFENTVVVGGMFDVNACMLGAGVNKPGQYCVIGGTWGINSAVVDVVVSDRSITQCCNYLYPNQYMCIDSAPTSCVNLEWFLKNVMRDMDYEEANRIVELQPMDEHLMYLPYLYRASDVNQVGSFIGLTAEHTYKDMLRAMYEGIVFEHARRIEKLKRAGIVYESAVLTGGAANSQVLCQMFANITGLNMETVRQSQTGSLGGVIISAVATGVYKTIDDAVEQMVKKKDTYIPSYTERYERKYQLFLKTVNQEER